MVWHCSGSVPPAGHIKIYSNEMLYENGIATGQLDVYVFPLTIFAMGMDVV